MKRPIATVIRSAALGLWLSAAAFACAADADGESVKLAIRRGVQAILDEQKPTGDWDEPQLPGGVTSLATYTLLIAGENPDDPHIAAALEVIRKLPNQHTYVASLKILVLTTAGVDRYRREINDAVRWLAAAQQTGGLWNYTEAGNRYDNSNSQFALLGLHAAAELELNIPFNVWQKAQTALLHNQNADGGWAYQTGRNSYGSMTAAGVANLLILGKDFGPNREHGFRDGQSASCGQVRTGRQLARGFEWLERNFQPGSNPKLGEYAMYWLYAVERVGILSGRRFFGQHDWYREGANILVNSQSPTGMWNKNTADTCLGILFLAKGHRSLLVQKLQWSHDDAWNPDRHDVSNLLDAIGTQLGQPVAWQVVPFDAPLEEWLAAPLLYMQGHTFPQWNDAQRAKLREFVLQGGTILAEACCGKAEFRSGFESFAAETFPEVQLKELGRTHAVYRVLHTVEPTGLRGIDLGCRTGVIYSPNDMSCLWEQGDVQDLSERAYKLGANIAAYAVGRRPLRDRLETVVLPKATTRPVDETLPPADAFRLAQIAYVGDWRPFPSALLQLGGFLREHASLDLVMPERRLQLTDPELRLSPILWLAGTYDVALKDEERDALAAHLRRGGFLIADACCGSEPFGGGLRKLLETMFPGTTLEKLPADHPVFRMTPGFDASRVRFSPDVQRAHPGLDSPELWGLRVDGRLAVIYSPYSLSCGLSGPAFEGCWGYEPESARRLAGNIVLYALTH